METFCNRLQRLRSQRGLSRYAVAKGAGISQQLMAHLETMPRGEKVHAGTMRKLARFFGLTIEELLGPLDDDEAHAA
jgi:transcriptional regulator with XRE-family HTH domain